MKWVQWQPSMMPPVQLQKASRGKPIALHFICRNGGKFLLQPWPPPDPFLALGDLFNLRGNQLVVECGGLQPKPLWSLVFPEDDSTNYDPSKHVWLLLLDSGKIQTLLLSSIQVKMHSLVHEMIVINMNLQLVWHLSATKQYISCDTQQLFEVLSEFLFFPSATRGAIWVLHHVAELRPMLWLPSSRRRWGELMKSSWPSLTQDECKSNVIDNWSVHWLSLECSNGIGLLVP